MATKLTNFVGGKYVEVEGVEYVPVVSPSTEETVALVPLSKASHVDEAVAIALKAFEDWSSITIKQRAAIMLKFHNLMDVHSQELAELIVKENGKNIVEALADVAKGNETVEWACSLPQLAPGRILEVSKGITCQESRVPLGVVGAIVPFNFPGKTSLNYTSVLLSLIALSHGSYVDYSNFIMCWKLCDFEAI
jgi:malonate-semialdehyde dehydrogenase (acetylating)/methylmalonate-semialdehyde dehydrogenase